MAPLSPTVSPTTPRTHYTSDSRPNIEHMDEKSGSAHTVIGSDLKQSITTESALSRVLSQLPNAEREFAEGRDAMHSGPPPGADAGNGGPPGGRPKLQKYSYGFFAPEMKMFRGIVFKILGGVLVLTIIVIWAGATFYWGSLWKSNHYTNKLTVRVIDLDGAAIGSAVSEFLLARKELGYFSTPADKFPDMAAIETDVVEEGAWATMVINAGATAALSAARAIGNSSYDGRSAISFIYSQARNELATGNYLNPLGQAALAQICGQLSAQSVAQFMAANGGNATAMALVAQAPGTLSNAISYTVVNMRPYNQPVAAAITLVGLIYMLIFSFVITMAGAGCREIIAPYLTTKAYLIYRLAVPLILYLPISLLFAMINLPFKVHFDAHFTYAGGFFLWWVILYLGMASVGLATEFAITILGPKFTPFFLLPWIIVNVSGAAVPHELQPWIYRYAVAMPFYNCSRAVRTIIFSTKNEIGKNCGILIAWIAVSCITVTLTTWLMRRKAVNEHMREIGEVEKDRKLPDGRVV